MNDEPMPELILRLARKSPLVGSAVYLFQDGTLSKEAAFVRMVEVLHENSRYDQACLRILRRAIETGDIERAREALHASGPSLFEWERDPDLPPETTA